MIEVSLFRSSFSNSFNQIHLYSWTECLCKEVIYLSKLR